jgi:hypothetical protein
MNFVFIFIAANLGADRRKRRGKELDEVGTDR